LRPSFGPELPDIPRITPSAIPLIREGEIDHIVFLMMENRSFDHMLGYRALKAHDVNGLTGNEENAIRDGNRPYRAKHNTKTKGIPSPGHHFDDTKEQVAEGAMTGFATNYVKRNGVTDPGLVMSFYTEVELPMYEFIANNFAVCDAWHSAHAGPTWPNRFCATTGETPELENFDITDDRIGYFKGTSIFDMLSRFGVDWCYAEGNVSFLRMFDRYRLDIRNVIPFTDDFEQGIEDTWENRVITGRLPSVSYIDPRFIDVPPAFDANDDLPPTDVCHGQRLVRRIYELLSRARTWSRTLLVVTYDEHGGFFDHVPPPGTPTAADPSPQPKVHPDGADHLGVRVPALIVSPWIDAGTVIGTPFDHTSIIKTILQRFAPSEHASGAAFGPRTEQANSIFDVLRDSPRPDTLTPPVPPEIECRHDIRTSRGPAAAIERDDFHAGMRFLGLPQARRADLVR
jgi:phospholipase C